MQRLKIFSGLTHQDKKLLTETWLLNWIIRLLLWILPFQKAQSIIERLAGNTQNNKTEISREKLIWAVKVTSSYVIGSTCLTNALTGHILLSRENYPNKLRIGVKKDYQGNFEAHAWLESDNKTVIGESEVEYQTIL